MNEESSATTPNRSRRALLGLGGMQELGVLIALICLCVGLSLSTQSFLSVQNLLQVARQASYYGIMAVGMVYVITMGDIDLSVGSILTLTNVTMAMALRANLPVPIALLIGLATGALCGFLNGTLAIALRIPMIIVTLGTLSVYRGVALLLCQSAPISQFSKDNWFFNTGGGNILGIPSSVVLMVWIGLIFWIILKRTAFGRHIEAIGGNPVSARLSGLPINRYRVAVMTLNGTIAALAGIMALAFLQSADPTTGVGFELWVIASVIIGGTALAGGQGSVPGAILGALIIAVISNGLILLGASTYAGTAVTGAVIILAVAIDSLIKRRANAGMRY